MRTLALGAALLILLTFGGGDDAPAVAQTPRPCAAAVHDSYTVTGPDGSNLGPLLTDSEQVPLRCMHDAEQRAYEGTKNFTTDINKGRIVAPN